MAANNASHRTTATLSKESLPSGGREVRENPQDDERTATQSNPPVHHVPTHGPTRFLYEVPPDTPIEELADLWERWNDDSEQADLAGWSK